MLHKFFTGLFVFLAICTFSQVSYDDVAVIINENSTVSVNIGSYYCDKHNIPEANKIIIQVPEEETIDTIQFQDALQQIKSKLLAHPDTESLNYMVTTKGVPLRVGGDICDSVPAGISSCSAFDSEIALLLGPEEELIGKNSMVENPYFDATGNFTRAEFGIFIVTRLDGFSEFEVMDLIDRSGPGTLVDKQKAQFIFDISGSFSPAEYDLFLNMLQPAHELVSDLGWNSILHSDTSLITDQMDVLGFVGFIRKTGYELNYSWLNGSLTTRAIGSTASSFHPDSAGSDLPLLADQIAEGATGGEGVIIATYGSLLLKYDKVFSRYLDSLQTFNLGESLYAGLNRLSWQHVIVGDPKMSIVADNNTGVFNPSLHKTDIRIWPNPSKDKVYIKVISDSMRPESFRVLDIYGRTVEQYSASPSNRTITIDVSKYSPGAYLVVGELQDGTRMVRKLVIN